MAYTVFGSFAFKDDGDGCISSKYLENSHITPLVECAKLDGKPGKELFEGNYKTTWVDAATKYGNAELKILKTGNIYILTWFGTSGKFSYEGKGFLYDGKLIGSYWKK